MVYLSDDAIKTIRSMRKSERKRLLKVFSPDELQAVLDLWKESYRFSTFYFKVLLTGIPMTRTDAYIANFHFELEHTHKLADD